MKRIFSLILGIVCITSMYAQTPQRTCATMEVDSIRRANDPKIGSLNDFEQWMHQKVTSMGNIGASQRSAVRVIPTVVHVIYSNNTENISTAQVLSQIEVLNEDFRRTNADTLNASAAFRAVAEDCNVEFCLAQIDPNGNPTTGINRVSLSGSPFSRSYIDNTIKPSTQWNPNDYFNVWVVNVGGGLLGWAQFPDASGLSGLNNSGGASNTDGVVLLYTSVGRPPANPFSGPYNYGRTATHEVGHWLGLRHIWGDGNCTVDDFCGDTPNSDGANYGCASGSVSCSSTDMVENYMDYSDDLCMSIFTNDQKSRMDVVLANSPRRASLLLSNVCNPNNVRANFSGTPVTGCAPLTVNFTDNSFGPVTGYQWDFGGLGTSTLQNPSFTFTTPGTYTISLIVTDGSNVDTLTETNYITVLGTGTGLTLPFAEDFEGTFPPNNWLIENPDVSLTWEQATVGGITPGNKAAKMDYFSYNAAGQRDGLITPQLNLSGYSSATLDFDHAYRRYNNGGTDSLIIYVSTSCGGSWVRVDGWGENGSGTFATSGRSTSAWTPSAASEWCFAGSVGTSCYTVDLTPFVGNSYVKVKFEGYNSYQNNLFVDNVNITGVAIPNPPVANFSSGNTSICPGGSISFTDNSTNSPTSWAWDFGDGNNSTAQNPSHTYAAPGTYTVTLAATNGVGTDTEIKNNFITVTTPPTGSVTTSPSTCGQNNGGAFVFAGGTGTLTYLWSNGSTTPSINNLAPGPYSITVTDGNSCTTVVSGTVASQPAPVASATSNATSCGLNNGTANATSTGGTSPLSYAWSNGGSTASINNLPSGTYTVTVTDGNGCTDTETVTVSASTSPVANASATQTGCSAPTGTATASPSGGAGSYAYAWSNGGNTATITGLAAGTFTVTVTDGAGCTSVETVNVTTTNAPTASATAVATGCGLANGSATASATGGTGSYSYAWSNGGSTATITGIAGGTYTVTVTDAVGCSDTETVTVGSSTAVSASASGTSTSCGQSNGNATAVATGGSGTYTYAWSNGGNTATISGLAAGTFTVTVTDGNGCTDISSTTINSSTALSAGATATATSCGGANGAANASATGGSGIYTYAWSNGGTTASLANLPAGSYTVTITDNIGCFDTTNVTVGSSASVVVNLVAQQNENCQNLDGALTVAGANTTGTYTYLWSNGATTAAISNLMAGNYSVTVTDNLGCSATASYTLTTTPPVFGSTTNISMVTCNNGADGAITAQASSGTPPYSFLWSNGATTSSVTGLGAGNYSVTISDASGCTNILNVPISEPNALASTFTVSDETAPGASDGGINYSIAGGTLPYSYLWSTGATTASLSSVPGGVYSVVVSDSNGCQFFDTISVGTLTHILEANDSWQVEIFPNPNAGRFSLRYELPQGDVYLRIYNSLGQIILTRDDLRGGMQTLELAPGRMARGAYFLEVLGAGFRETRKFQVE